METQEKEGNPSPLLLAAVGLFAGILNGFLGTGGGTVLILALARLMPGREKEAFTLSTACVLVFSVLSIILYTILGKMSLSAAKMAFLPAMVGGAAGAFLLGRIKTEVLRCLFAALVIYSGIRLLL